MELAERKLEGNLFQRPIAVIEKVLPASVALLYFGVTKLKSALRVFLECCWLFKCNSLFKSRFKYSGVALIVRLYIDHKHIYFSYLYTRSIMHMDAEQSYPYLFILYRCIVFIHL